jgi:hypothetical protein
LRVIVTFSGSGPLQPKSLGAPDSIQEIGCGLVAVAKEQQGARFINDVISRHKSAALAHKLTLQIDGSGMVLICRVPQSEEAGGVHKDLRLGHK